MSIFGFSSKKEVEKQTEEAKNAGINQGLNEGLNQGLRQGVEYGIQQVLDKQQTDLENLSVGSQIDFAVPYFDIPDYRFEDYSIPVSVQGTLIYEINDIDKFKRLNRAESYSDAYFKKKLQTDVTIYTKEALTNASSELNLPAVHLERHLSDISRYIQAKVGQEVEQIYGIDIRTLKVTNIRIDKDCPEYTELLEVTKEQERLDNLQNRTLNRDAKQRQYEMNMSSQEKRNQMQLEDEAEMMKFKREESKKSGMFGMSSGMGGGSMFSGINTGGLNNNFSGGMFGSAPTPPPMGGCPVPPPAPAIPQISLYIALNGQQTGPFGMQQLQQMSQTGQLTPQTLVWKEGLPAWTPASSIPELSSLFTQTPPIPTPGVPPTIPGGGNSAPIL